ncbi:unnamed protein product, partial [Pleuronectes platessa]
FFSKPLLPLLKLKLQQPLLGSSSQVLKSPSSAANNMQASQGAINNPSLPLSNRCLGLIPEEKIAHRSRGSAPRPAHSLRDTRPELLHVKELVTDSPAAQWKQLLLLGETEPSPYLIHRGKASPSRSTTPGRREEIEEESNEQSSIN